MQTIESLVDVPSDVYRAHVTFVHRRSARQHVSLHAYNVEDSDDAQPHAHDSLSIDRW